VVRSPVLLVQHLVVVAALQPQAAHKTPVVMALPDKWF
jgi:hypothetical protein